MPAISPTSSSTRPRPHPRLSDAEGRAVALHRHACRRRALRPCRRGGEALAGMARGDRAGPEGLAPRPDRRAARALSRASARMTRAACRPPIPARRRSRRRSCARRTASRSARRTRRSGRRSSPRSDATAAQHRRHGRLCGAQRLSAAEGAARPRPDRPAVRGAATKLKRVEEALARAIRKWPTGIYVAWRPIREAVADAHFLNAVAALGAPNILRLELDVGPGQPARTGSGRWRAPASSSSTRRTRSRRGAPAHALARRAACARRARRACLRMADRTALAGKPDARLPVRAPIGLCANQ